MNWQDIREQYTHCWVVVEAINAYTKGAHRIIEHLEVVETFGDDFQPAWECYKRVHAADLHREYYPIHTDREALNIGVIDAFGRVL